MQGWLHTAVLKLKVHKVIKSETLTFSPLIIILYQRFIVYKVKKLLLYKLYNFTNFITSIYA